MTRRDFFSSSGQLCLGLTLVSASGCVRFRSFESRDGSTTRKLVADLEEQIPKLMAEANVPGVSLAVIQDARIVWRQGFGYSDRGVESPVKEDTVFQAASMSKPVFAYVALKLCETGVIGLDTPLSNYGAEPFLEGDARADHITARMVLAHCSGLPNFRSHDAPLKINFPPGTHYTYSGEGYYYLQSIITRLMGQTDQTDCATFEADLRVCATDIGAFLQNRILVPFGMNLSRYIVDESIEHRLATGHDEDGKPLPKPQASRPAITRYAAMGGLLTTPTDYAKFVIEVINPRQADDVRLKRESLREMLRPQIRVPAEPRSSSWGLGWQLQDNGLINHGGDNRGFHCHAIASPKKKSGLVVMTNGENGWKIIPTLLARPALASLLGA